MDTINNDEFEEITDILIKWGIKLMPFNEWFKMVESYQFKKYDNENFIKSMEKSK